MAGYYSPRCEAPAAWPDFGKGLLFEVVYLTAVGNLELVSASLPLTLSSLLPTPPFTDNLDERMKK